MESLENMNLTSVGQQDQLTTQLIQSWQRSAIDGKNCLALDKIKDCSKAHQRAL